jgi:cytochrome c biogenesis protein CcmG/thiol:disulfide interchange protein DsbE
MKSAMSFNASDTSDRPMDASRRRAAHTVALAGGLLAASSLSPLGARLARAAPTTSAHWPDMPLKGLKGQPITLPSGPWRATLVDFWASWCAPCRLSFPWMNRLHERLAGKGLRIVAVNLDRRAEDALRFLAAHPARFEIAMDPAAESASALQIQAMPTSLLLAADGSIRWTHRGFRESDIPGLERNIEGALA